MKKPIPSTDRTFYFLESHDSPKHVGAVQIFRLPAKAGDDYLLRLVEKLRELPVREPFNFKPVFPRVGMPQWHSDEKMEMQYHLRHSALPRPGNMQQLMAVIQRLHTGILDRERPGWICQVIEGLEDDRFAVYVKIHHAYIDGKSAVLRIYGALSQDPENQEVDAIWSHQPAAAETPEKENQSGGAADQSRGGGTARTQIKGITDLGRQLLGAGLELAGLREHSGHIPFRAPRTRISKPMHSDLRSMGVTTMPLDQLKQICAAGECTLNDVVLTLIDAALNDYLARHDEYPERPLVAAVPMSLRDADDTTANTQVAMLTVELGQPGASLRQRLDQVTASTESAKDDARKLSREGLINYAMLMFGVLELLQNTGLDRVLPPSSNLLVSNVPGPHNDAMYLMGARMEAIYPLTTLAGGNNLMITLLSHGNSLDFGILAAEGVIPDIDYLVERLNRRFEELASEVGAGSSSRRKATARQKSTRGAKAKTKAKAKTRARSKQKPPVRGAAKQPRSSSQR